MYYVDSQRTLTRRESSLITTKRLNKDDGETCSESVPFTTDSLVSVVARPKCPVQAELVTMMFESMLDHIVESWTPIVPHKRSDSYYNMDLGKTGSDVILVSGTKKKKPVVKSSKTKRSRSKLLGLAADAQDTQQISWWSAPDEKAIICFRNGNLYEGNISMKCMHGEGRFQWADGTVYLGQFKDNEMNGKGLIQWKDDTWYEGEFAGNLRHGHGLYVDSRLQRSYVGGWYCGAKHGEGTIYYTRTFNNSYDGQWIHNERFGYGSREYCPASGYKGEWERNIREGKGLMIWPNNDCYRGGWKNGVMSGYGIYLWDSYYNNSMSVPSLKEYRGYWLKGQRDGYGKLSLGLGLGAYYKGEFKNNKKNGTGKFVTINGLILQDNNLFIDDNLGPLKEDENSPRNHHKRINVEPWQFDICDSTVGLLYHIEQAFKNIDRQDEIITNIVNDYLQNNKIDIPLEDATQAHAVPMDHKTEQHRYHSLEKLNAAEPDHLQDLIMFEKISLRKSLTCYETDLRNIYYKYATICNSEEITFTPVMIRLYLWQLYNDCNIHQKGMTLYDIDLMFYQNREWMARSPHDPFEKIYFWQFLHSLISVANKLYAKKYMPGPKPDTILASGFRMFMEEDVLPGANKRKGYLVNGYGAMIPLKATYALYQNLGQPHTIRKFLRAVRRSPHFQNRPQPPMTDAPEECLPIGRNCYIFGDDMSFTVDELPEPQETIDKYDLNLFNFANLSTKTIIKIFANIFPQVLQDDKIMDLNVNLTFFEFFEVFIECCLESIKVKEEEMKWRAKFAGIETTPAPHSTPTGYGGKFKYAD